MRNMRWKVGKWGKWDKNWGDKREENEIGDEKGRKVEGNKTKVGETRKMRKWGKKWSKGEEKKVNDKIMKAWSKDGEDKAKNECKENGIKIIQNRKKRSKDDAKQKKE